MSGLGLGGLSSGMNTDAIIEKILQFEGRKITSQQMRKAQVEARQEAWRQVRSSLTTLRSRLDGIRLSSAFTARKVTLSDATVADVTAAAGSTLTVHSLGVKQLAQFHVVASNHRVTQADGVTQVMAIDSANKALNVTGTLQVGAATVNVQATDTLNSIRDAINKAGGSTAKADVVKVTEGASVYYRLTLTAKNQGASGAISFAGSTDDLLKQLGFMKPSDPGPGFELNTLSAAQDARFTLNGMDYTSSTNQVSDLVPGLMLTLRRAGTELAPLTTTINVDANLDQTIGAVENWVKALNEAQDLLRDASKFDSETGKKGLLNGDPLVRQIQTTLRDLVSRQVVGLPDNLNRLSQIGVTTGAFGSADYGRVLVDKEALRTALGNDATGVAKLFGAVANNLALSSAGATVDAATSATAVEPGKVYNADDVLNGITDSDRFGTMGGGWQSAAVPSAGSPVRFVIDLGGTKLIEQIRTSQPSTGALQPGQVGLKNFTVEYLAADGQWKTAATVTNHAAMSHTASFDPVTASKVRITVTETHGNNPVRLTGIEAVARNDGTAAGMFRYLNQTLLQSQTGALDTRESTFKTQLADIGRQITKLQDQLAKRDTQLRAQFTRMEQAMAKLQNQSGYIQVLSQMATGGTNNRR